MLKCFLFQYFHFFLVFKLIAASKPASVTSQIRLHIEYLIQTYYIFVLML